MKSSQDENIVRAIRPIMATLARCLEDAARNYENALEQPQKKLVPLIRTCFPRMTQARVEWVALTIYRKAADWLPVIFNGQLPADRDVARKFLVDGIEAILREPTHRPKEIGKPISFRGGPSSSD